MKKKSFINNWLQKLFCKKKNRSKLGVFSRQLSSLRFFFMLQQKDFFSQCNANECDIKLSQLFDYAKFFDKYRAQSLAIEEIYKREQEFYKLSVRVKNCSNFLRFSIENNNFVLKEANFSCIRYCQICSWRKSLYRRAELYKAYEKIKLKNSNFNFIFLTLTVKNCHISELRLMLNKMNEAWHKLTKRKQFINVVKGYIRSTEITRDSVLVNTHAHPHLHCVLAVKSSYYSKENYIKQSVWAQIWRECLCVDYVPIVDIRSVKKKYNNSNAVKSAIIETLKYSVKYQDVNINIDDSRSRNWFYMLTRETRKLRFFATGGIFKDAIKDDSEISDEDLVKLSNNYERLSNEELFNFVFCRSKKYYRYEPYF